MPKRVLFDPAYDVSERKKKKSDKVTNTRAADEEVRTAVLGCAGISE